eukprot:SAG31_NODE_35699_length_320_cov_1.398190_1_plen_26_part_01
MLRDWLLILALTGKTRLGPHRPAVHE